MTYKNGLFQVKLAPKVATVVTKMRTTMTRSTTVKRSARTQTKNFSTRADPKDTTIRPE